MCGNSGRDINLVMSYFIGDKVTWSSQSAGFYKNKVGVVVALVPSRQSVNPVLASAGIRGRIKNPGAARDHMSYVVRSEGRLYWPRVNQLRPLAEGEPAALKALLP